MIHFVLLSLIKHWDNPSCEICVIDGIIDGHVVESPILNLYGRNRSDNRLCLVYNTILHFVIEVHHMC